MTRKQPGLWNRMKSILSSNPKKPAAPSAEEIAAPTLMGVRQVIYQSVANYLTPERLAQIMSSVDQGDALDYLTLAEEMEERHLHYRSVLSTRKLAVSGISRTVEAVSDDPEDVKVADAVREMLGNEEVDGLVADLLDAIGKGFSVCEIIWDTSSVLWTPSKYKWRDPRHFQFDRETLNNVFLRDAKDPVNGLALEPNKFIVHRPHLKTGLTIRGGLARLVAVAYMCGGYTLKDWLAFVEVFGMPLRIGKYGANATKDQKDILLRAVSQIGTDAACIIPDSMMIDFKDGARGSGGELLFQGLCDWLNRQISKGVLGQTSTSDAQAAGLGSNQADVHNEVRNDIKVSDAKQLAATLRRDLVKPFVDFNFGERPRNKYPLVKLAEESPEDLVMLSQALPPFIDRGLRVEESVILDKFGLSTPEDGAALLSGKAPVQPFGAGPAGAPPGGNSPEGTPPAAGEKPTINLNRDTFDAVIGKLRLAMAKASNTTPDIIDEQVTKALGGWRKVMSPILDPIVALAKDAKDEKEFREKLAGLLGPESMDLFVDEIATLTFKARGLGDAQDSPR